MTRAAQEILEAHLQALAKADVAAVLEDYREDAVLLTLDGALRGREAIGEFFTGAFAALPDAVWDLTAASCTDDAVLFRWTATSPLGRVRNGVDTVVVSDGAIRLQTASFDLEPRG